MKLLYSICGLFFLLRSAAQVVRIPDPNFKQRVIALGYDTNGDNQIQLTEAQQVKKLYVNGLGIVNMEGINSFTNLEELGCYNNNLSSLDVSKLKKLKYLYAYNNRIESVNIRGLQSLEHLYVQNNFLLTTLDLSGLTALTELFVMGNKLKKIDVSGLGKLEKIDAESNQIETALLTKAPKLKSVNLKNNLLSVTVDIRDLAYLEYFNAEGCNLLYLNFSGTISLKEYHW
ncbi:leucine rich repeat (LRR) protein [Lacibacter cauensis]|uniref:Leucine rich repeat (LRR) protein n=1 Tax=Lacibacter cauensis TaxID=510947 RepID=A0A562SWU0_9BACT|nr:leucine-rich repeat domain-containing protein [Lacibacter cauensis]TWI85749.1 leucine rich repeat (LRR) protein [Lacibacter cauensis]